MSRWSTLAFMFLLACNPDFDDVGNDGANADECLSGIKWVGGNRESSRMHPGRDCLGCHASIDEAEEIVLAGTVYEAFDEPDECFGVAGVTVRITDSNDRVIELTTNSAGNFLLESEGAGIVPPYTAKLIYAGRERVMASMQTETSCNSCHAETGLQGAPGRLLVP